MTLSEAKLRQEQLLSMAAEIEKQGIFGFEGLSVRYASGSHVHKVTSPKIWEETISAIVTDMREEADSLVASIEASSAIKDTALLEAKKALSSNDFKTALQKYTIVYAHDPSKYLSGLIQDLENKVNTVLSEEDKVNYGELSKE